MPRFQMYVNSDVNVLSFEGNFVLLHTGTVLICCLILVCSHLQKYKPIIIVPTFSSENMKNTPRGCLAAGGSQPPRASACSVYHSVSDCKHSNSVLAIYLTTTFTALSPILTMPISPLRRVVEMFVVSEPAFAEPTIWPERS